MTDIRKVWIMTVPVLCTSPASPESFTLKTLETTDEAGSC